VRWRAAIGVIAEDGKSKPRHLGCFLNQVDEALAYDQPAREHHKDKAQLNFPDLPPQPQVASSKTTRQPTSQYRGKDRLTWAFATLPCDGRVKTSGARAAGVYRSGKWWQVRIKAATSDGKSKMRHVGSFGNEVDAALAYDQAAREHHGDKAQVNFPPPQPRVATSQYRGTSSSI
jgi:hypothetical protein